MEDDALKMLRSLERKKKDIEEAILSGCPLDNVSGGYMHTTGQRVGLQMAIDICYEVFAGWLPNPPAKLPKKRPYADY